jgi:thiamine biosynthesis protein ThiS
LPDSNNERRLTIVANGTSRDVAVESSIEDFLESLDLVAAQVAVEHNGKIVPRTKFSETTLADGDKVEIVTLVGGG